MIKPVNAPESEYAPIPKLNPRLEKIFEAVPQCRSAADIGTDHAYIPVCLIISGKAKRSVAADIGKGPLDRAEETVKKYKTEDNISLRLGGGLSVLKKGEAEVLIIAGMGGLLISKILRESNEIAKSAKSLILQPMTAAKELREFLTENGYRIDCEILAREDEKIYNIMKVSVGESEKLSVYEKYIGKNLTPSPDFEEYFRQRISKLDKSITGLKKSKNEENLKKAQKLTEIKEMIENESNRY